jgi:MFS family permease
VLLALLGFSILLSIVFLLLPFLSVRKTWRALPHKGKSAGFFAALGFGFILFEITLIQKLVLFLGYPTYSLTVSLSSLLIFVGIGAFFSGRWAEKGERLVLWLTAALTVITAYYLFGLQPTTNALQQLPLGARMAIAFAVIAPLGFCLGMFLPIGLGRVGRLSAYPREYIAWCWAVNGFASVVGSVLATILAMTYGFRIVFVIAFALYLVALVALRALVRATPLPQDDAEPPPAAEESPATLAVGNREA